MFAPALQWSTCIIKKAKRVTNNNSIGWDYGFSSVCFCFGLVKKNFCLLFICCGGDISQNKLTTMHQQQIIYHYHYHYYLLLLLVWPLVCTHTEIKLVGFFLYCKGFRNDSYFFSISLSLVWVRLDWVNFVKLKGIFQKYESVQINFTRVYCIFNI